MTAKTESLSSPSSSVSERTRRYIHRLISECYPYDGIFDYQHVAAALDLTHDSEEYRRFSKKILTPLFGPDRRFKLSRDDFAELVVLAIELESEWTLERG